MSREKRQRRRSGQPTPPSQLTDTADSTAEYPTSGIAADAVGAESGPCGPCRGARGRGLLASYPRRGGRSGGRISDDRVQLSQNLPVERLHRVSVSALTARSARTAGSTPPTGIGSRLTPIAGKSIRAIAAEIGCSVGTIHRVLGQWRVVE